MKQFLIFVLALILFASCDDSKKDSLCGNGAVDSGEECDATNLGGYYCDMLGFYGGTLGCTRDCLLDLDGCREQGSCGDGIIQEDFEICDASELPVLTCDELGYGEGALSCNANCHYNLAECTGSATCGDTVIQTNEQCDGTNLGGYTCGDLAGFVGGELGCGADCLFNTRFCYREVLCGDGLIRGDEQCDGQNISGKDCADFGYDGGVLACGDDCRYDFSGCIGDVLCGDEQRNGEEECDGVDLGGASCLSLGYHGGELACTDDCKRDLSSCLSYGRCGDGEIQVGEELCDGENLGSETCQTQGYYSGELLCSFDCKVLEDVYCDGFCGDAIRDEEYGEACDYLDFGELSTLGMGCWFSELSCDASCQASLTGDCTNVLLFQTVQDDRVTGLVEDRFGSTFVAGITAGSMNGAASSGGLDGWVAKVNKVGGTTWMTQFGGALNDMVQTAVLGPDDGVFLAGGTEGALGSSSAGGVDAFVSLVSSDGSVLWTLQFGTAGSDEILDAVSDALGNIYVVGTTDGDLAGAMGGVDAFIAKVSPGGSLLWTTQWGTSADDRALGVTMDASGNILVTGGTSGDLEGVGAGGEDGFVTRLDGAGQLLWSVQLGSPADDLVRTAVSDGADGWYIVGETGGSLGDGSWAGGRDGFLASLGSDGSLSWSSQFGNDLDQSVVGVRLADQGIVVVGTTEGALDGSGFGGEDVFMLIYDAAGVEVGSNQEGTAFNDRATAMLISANGFVFAGGFTLGRFGSLNAAESEEAMILYIPWP